MAPQSNLHITIFQASNLSSGYISVLDIVIISLAHQMTCLFIAEAAYMCLFITRCNTQKTAILLMSHSTEKLKKNNVIL